MAAGLWVAAGPHAAKSRLEGCVSNHNVHVAILTVLLLYPYCTLESAMLSVGHKITQGLDNDVVKKTPGNYMRTSRYFSTDMTDTEYALKKCQYNKYIENIQKITKNQRKKQQATIHVHESYDVCMSDACTPSTTRKM